MLKKADIGVGLYLLAAVVFFIVPIPSILLDVMLAINISIALIILFNVLFAKEVLDFLPNVAVVYDDLSNFAERIIHSSDSSYRRSG